MDTMDYTSRPSNCNEASEQHNDGNATTVFERKIISATPHHLIDAYRGCASWIVLWDGISHPIL
jgi:hypothetical protein